MIRKSNIIFVSFTATCSLGSYCFFLFTGSKKSDLLKILAFGARAMCLERGRQVGVSLQPPEADRVGGQLRCVGGDDG